MKKSVLAFAILLLASPAFAQQAADTAKVDAAIKSAFPTAPADWVPRLTPDETMRQCSAAGNLPSPKVGDDIQKRERGTIVYPDDGQFIGDWKKGEALAAELGGTAEVDYRPRGVVFTLEAPLPELSHAPESAGCEGALHS